MKFGIVMFEQPTLKIIGLADISSAFRVFQDIKIVDHGTRLAPTAGFEPATKWLTATYSTAELCRSIFHTLEPAIRLGELTVTYSVTELCQSILHVAALILTSLAIKTSRQSSKNKMILSVIGETCNLGHLFPPRLL